LKSLECEHNFKNKTIEFLISEFGLNTSGAYAFNIKLVVFSKSASIHTISIRNEPLDEQILIGIGCSQSLVLGLMLAAAAGRFIYRSAAHLPSAFSLQQNYSAWFLKGVLEPLVVMMPLPDPFWIAPRWGVTIVAPAP